MKYAYSNNWQGRDGITGKIFLIFENQEEINA